MLDLNHSIKFIAVMAASLLATCLCFYLMFALIARELDAELDLQPVSYVAPSVATWEPEERKPVRERPEKVLPLEPPPEPKGQGALQPVRLEISAERPEFGNLADQLGPNDIRLELEAPHSDLSPLFIVQPNYPISAAMRDIEGYVIVEFSVEENGSVLNPIIIQSEPALLFDEAALNAISRFRFKPREVGGDPVRADNVQLRFSFNLDSLYAVEGGRR